MAFNPHDHFFKKAKKENFAARSVYKLEEIDKRYKIFKPNDRILDLGASPGSWSQYVSQKVGPSQAVKYSFLTVAVWWFVFTMPMAFFLKEKPHPEAATAKHEPLWAAFPQLIQSFKKLIKQKPIFYFLLAYWFYIDGVYTVYTMAVDYGLSIGLEDKDLMKALVITQFVGFPSALFFGKLSEKFSVKGLLISCLAVYTVVLFFSMGMKTGTDFMILAGFINGSGLSPAALARGE